MSEKLPSPSEVRSTVDDDELGRRLEIEAARARLRAALKRSGGHYFTYAADLIPLRVANTLLNELYAAGWKYKLVRDSRDGDYYEIAPRWLYGVLFVPNKNYGQP